MEIEFSAERKAALFVNDDPNRVGRDRSVRCKRRRRQTHTPARLVRAFGYDSFDAFRTPFRDSLASLQSSVTQVAKFYSVVIAHRVIANGLRRLEVVQHNQNNASQQVLSEHRVAFDMPSPPQGRLYGSGRNSSSVGKRDALVFSPRAGACWAYGPRYSGSGRSSEEGIIVCLAPHGCHTAARRRSPSFLRAHEGCV